MRVYVLALFALLLACEQKGTSTSTTAPAHKLPVKYQSCNAEGRDCYVTAAFEDLRSCENYHRVTASYFDTASVPGIMVCNRAGPPACDTQRVPGSITCPLGGTSRLLPEISTSQYIGGE
jgi:hypothetical protein